MSQTTKLIGNKATGEWMLARHMPSIRPILRYIRVDGCASHLNTIFSEML